MDLPSVVTAIAGAIAFLALAVATYAALRVEQVRRDLRRTRPHCGRVHASEVAALWLARERGKVETADTPPIADLDLPFSRSPPPRVVDEDEVNPRLGAEPVRTRESP